MVPRYLIGAGLALVLTACGTRSCEPEVLPPPADPLPSYPEAPPRAETASPPTPAVEIVTRSALTDYLLSLGVQPPEKFMVPDACWLVRERILMLATPNRHGPHLIVPYGGGQLIVAWRERDLYAASEPTHRLTLASK